MPLSISTSDTILDVHLTPTTQINGYTFVVDFHNTIDFRGVMVSVIVLADSLNMNLRADNMISCTRIDSLRISDDFSLSTNGNKLFDVDSGLEVNPMDSSLSAGFAVAASDVSVAEGEFYSRFAVDQGLAIAFDVQGHVGQGTESNLGFSVDANLDHLAVRGVGKLAGVDIGSADTGVSLVTRDGLWLESQVKLSFGGINLLNTQGSAGFAASEAKVFVWAQNADLEGQVNLLLDAYVSLLGGDMRLEEHNHVELIVGQWWSPMLSLYHDSGFSVFPVMDSAQVEVWVDQRLFNQEIASISLSSNWWGNPWALIADLSGHIQIGDLTPVNFYSYLTASDDSAPASASRSTSRSPSLSLSPSPSPSPVVTSSPVPAPSHPRAPCEDNNALLVSLASKKGVTWVHSCQDVHKYCNHVQYSWLLARVCPHTCLADDNALLHRLACGVGHCEIQQCSQVAWLCHDPELGYSMRAVCGATCASCQV